MPTVVLAPPLARWLSTAPGANVPQTNWDVRGATLREVLYSLFALHPNLRGYVLDDQGALRHHVVAFVDGVAVQDKAALAEAVSPNSEVYLLQALSGG